MSEHDKARIQWRRWFRAATRYNADITMDRVDSSNVEPDICSMSYQVPRIMTRRSAPRKNDKAVANALRHRLPFLKVVSLELWYP